MGYTIFWLIYDFIGVAGCKLAMQLSYVFWLAGVKYFTNIQIELANTSLYPMKAVNLKGVVIFVRDRMDPRGYTVNFTWYT